MGVLGNSAGLLFKIDADSSGVKREFAAIDSSISSLGGKMSSFGGMATVAAAGIAAIGAAAVTAGRFLFDLAQTAADYGSIIYDAQQKTGLAAATLSTLKLASDSAGSSFENISGSISKFAVLVGQANQGNEKAIATLDKYKITARDLNGALEQAIKAIAAESDETKQAAAAKDLFKDKTGAVLPVVKQLDGDLRKATQAGIKMGTVLGEDDVKAADDLGDAIGLVSEQVRIGASKFALAYGPQITGALGKISTELAENQDKWTKWGTTVGNILSGVTQGISAAAEFARNNPVVVKTILNIITAGAFSGGYYVAKELDNVGKGGSLLREAPTQYAPGDPRDPKNDPRNPFYKPPQGREAGVFGVGASQDDDDEAQKAADERAKKREAAFQRELAARSKQAALLLAGQRTAFAAANADWEKSFLAGETTKEEFRKVALENIEAYGRNVQALLDFQKGNELEGKVGTERLNVETQYTQATAALSRELAKEREDLETTITGTVKKENDERVQSNKDANAETLKDAKAVTARLISDFDVLFAKKLITERQYNEAVGVLKLKQLELEKALTDDARERFRIDQEIKTLRNELSIQGIELAEQELEAANAVTEAIRQQNLEWENLFAIVANEEASPFQTIIDGWNSVADAMAESLPGMTDVIDIMANAFSGMANAIGNVVQQYVMYGKTAPGIMRQVLAQALAAIAAEAAMRAVYALAMGFFFLATHQYVDATNAFISAAIFGSIAVGAALLGRAVAPKQQAQASFNSQASTATSSGGNPGQGSAGKAGVYSSQEDMTVERGRNTPMGRLAVELVVRSRDAFADMFAFEISKNGRLRSAIQDAAAA